MTVKHIKLQVAVEIILNEIFIDDLRTIFISSKAGLSKSNVATVGPAIR